MNIWISEVFKKMCITNISHKQQGSEVLKMHSEVWCTWAHLKVTCGLRNVKAGTGLRTEVIFQHGFRL